MLPTKRWILGACVLGGLASASPTSLAQDAAEPVDAPQVAQGPWRSPPADEPPPRVVAPPQRDVAPGPRLVWNDRWARVRPVEYVSTVALGAGTIAAFQIPVQERGWRGNGFDDAVRDAIRLRTHGERSGARTMSDVLFYGLMAYPAVDVLVATSGSTDVGWQVFMISAQSMLLSGATSTVLTRTTGRERPFVARCGADPDYAGDCDETPDQQNQSFASGHALIAFTGAGLACAHHSRLPLYGGGVPDALGCGFAMAAATVEGGLRVAADRHYLTDALAGAALGIGSGYFLPMVMHYTAGGSSERAAAPRLLLPYATESQAGLLATGAF